MAIDGLNVDLMFTNLVSDIESKFAHEKQYTDILDWYDNGGVDKERLGIELTPQQRLVLATYYGIELTEEQQSILEFWKLDDRTTYDFDFGPNVRQNLVLECGRRGGKCARFNFLQFSQDQGMIYGYEVLGQLMGIKQGSALLTEEGIKELALRAQLKDTALSYKETVAIEGKGKRAESDALYVKGMSKTRAVTTSCGYSLEATPEHRIKVMAENGTVQWRYFSDIREGDYVCIHRNTDLFPKSYLKLSDYYPDATEYSQKSRQLLHTDSYVDKEYGYLIGLLTANGSWTIPSGLQLTHHTSDASLYFDTLYGCLDLLGLSDYIKTKVRSANGMYTMCNSSNLRSLFDNLGFTIESRVNKKKTPWSIRRSPKDVQAAYLSGLFDGDGSVEKGGRCITLSTASKTLATETQLLLLNFGIVCRVKEKIVKERPYYILTLRGQRSVRCFVEEIGFKLERKQNLVLESLAKASRDGGDTERIPYQLEWLKRLREYFPDNKGMQPGSRQALTSYEGQKLETLRNWRLEYRSIVGNSIKESSSEMLSSYRLTSLLEHAEQFGLSKDTCAEVAHFRYLQDCDYFYDPVVSVEDSEAFCVDLSVPGPHEYVSQGMTNHNSLLGSFIITYEFEKLCRMESPQKTYGIASSTLISIICVAPSAEQVVKTIYGQARAMMYNVPFLARLIKAGKIDPQEKAIKYDEKLLYIYSGNSKSETQVGGSPLLIVLDEGALFEDKDGRSNALTLWDNLGAGGLVFKHDAKRIIISSAWREGDALQVLYKAAKESQGWIGYRLRSWDMNPLFASRDNPVIDSMYITERKMAELLFEGIRSSALNTYFDPDVIKPCFDHMSTLYASEQPIGDDKLIKLQITQLEPFTGKTIMHLDPAVVHDAYALAFGHSYMHEGELHVVIDGIMAWKPREGCHVSIVNVQQAIYNIHLKRPLYRVTSDPKESSETLQRLKTSGIPTDIINFSNPKQLAMYDVVRKLASEHRLHLPKNSPWTTLLKDELLRLELKQTKVTSQAKIDHPSTDGSSKDIADCVAAVCYQLAAESFENSFERVKHSLVSANNNQEPALLMDNDLPTFDKRSFTRELKQRKKPWQGISSFTTYQ